MIKELSKTSFDRIKKSYLGIFSSNNPFEDCFNKEIKKVDLLFPVEGYKLTKEQYNALILTIRNIYVDEEVFVSEIETESIEDIFRPNNNDTKYVLKHWSIDLSTSYDEYAGMDINVENAIYSSKNNWGIIVSHEGHAIIGGNTDFLDVFKTIYTKFDNSIECFQEYWEYNRKHYNSDNEWYDKFIQSLKR